MKKIVVPTDYQWCYVAQQGESDHLWLIDLHNDHVVLNNMTHPEPISYEHHMNWWKRTSLDEKQLRLIFRINNTNAGFMKFYDIDRTNRSMILGADLHANFRGKGHAKYMWTMMLQMCFDKGFGFSGRMNRAALTVAEFNDVAIHLYKSLGFQEEGRLTKSLYRDGKYYDQICMYMLHSDWESND